MKRPRPRCPRTAELATKDGWGLDVSEDPPVAFPELFVVGNYEGLMYLSRFIAYVAARSKLEDDIVSESIGGAFGVFDNNYTDMNRIRFVGWKDTTKHWAMDHVRMSPSTRALGDLRDRYKRIIELVDQDIRKEKELQRRMDASGPGQTRSWYSD